ncbi:MAG TPA: indolepyruvate oxidoreductase subunit beta [Steroidobacteraceae bacterium]|nr:indolepyruvate oxidoreductase subunit beta [Steroidobacteraceae bacterium]
MLRSQTLDIFVCGVGGQGVMTAADVLAQAAIAHGYDCKKSEIAGLSQRGGVVTSQVRIGPHIESPVIGPGCADLLLAFELAEALRAAHQLKSGGIAMVNTIRLPPPVVSLGLYRYPDDPLGQMRAAGIRAYDIDAGAIARELGDLRLVNSVMLGAVADFLPFPAADLEAQLIERFRTRKPALLDQNRRAFAAGRQAARASRILAA